MIPALRQFHATFLSGWWRWPREHFQVLVGRDPGALHPLRAPCGRYYADPFPWVEAGQAWLFVEEFNYSRNRGRLAALPLDADLRAAGPARPLNLPGDIHLSYPLVFSAGGELLLLPETGARGTVDLYTCERFPDRWRHRCCLLSGIDAVDTTPLWHAGRWWLFTAVRTRPGDGGRRSLAIYSAENLFQGAWEPHPVNAARRYADSPVSDGRPAGPLVPLPQGGWLRPTQANRRYYGEGSRWMRITTLNPGEFVEQPFDGPHPLVELSRRRSPHHVAAAGGVIVCDVRDRHPAKTPRGAGGA